MRQQYKQIYEGDWVKLAMRDQRIACCDCQLVHRTNYRKTKQGLLAQVFRENRSTAMRRRHRGLKIVHE